MPQNSKFKLGKCVLDFNLPPPTSEHFYNFNHCKMTSLLQVASWVEAAIDAYLSVQDFVGWEEWKLYFKGELVSSHLHSVSIFNHFTFQIEKCDL